MTDELKDDKKALAEVNQRMHAEEARLLGTVKMYFVPVAFLVGSLLGFIAGRIQ